MSSGLIYDFSKVEGGFCKISPEKGIPQKPKERGDEEDPLHLLRLCLLRGRRSCRDGGRRIERDHRRCSRRMLQQCLHCSRRAPLRPQLHRPSHSRPRVRSFSPPRARGPVITFHDHPSSLSTRRGDPSRFPWRPSCLFSFSRACVVMVNPGFFAEAEGGGFLRFAARVRWGLIVSEWRLSLVDLCIWGSLFLEGFRESFVLFGRKACSHCGVWFGLVLVQCGWAQSVQWGRVGRHGYEGGVSSMPLQFQFLGFFSSLNSIVFIHYLLTRGCCLQDQELLDCSEQHPEGRSNSR